MLQPWQTGVVIKIEDETAFTKRFYIQIPAVERFDFIPGQFVTLDLPIHEKKNKRWRSYSIASPPNGTNVIELLIVVMEGGAGTTYLFNEVNVGSELTLRGPQGVFVLPKGIDRDLFFICTGTGVAPFRSMLYYLKEHPTFHKKIYLIFGTRLMSDCLYMKEFQELEKEMENFFYLPTCSRENDSVTAVRRGYVHAIYEEIISNDHSPAYFFLCGWKNMIDEAKQRITALGYDRKDIHLELYG